MLKIPPYIRSFFLSISIPYFNFQSLSHHFNVWFNFNLVYFFLFIFADRLKVWLLIFLVRLLLKSQFCSFWEVKLKLALDLLTISKYVCLWFNLILRGLNIFPPKRLFRPCSNVILNVYIKRSILSKTKHQAYKRRANLSTEHHEQFSQSISSYCRIFQDFNLHHLDSILHVNHYHHRRPFQILI